MALTGAQRQALYRIRLNPEVAAAQRVKGAAYKRSVYARDREKILKRVNAYKAKYPERTVIYQAYWYSRNKIEHSAARKVLYALNIDAERANARTRRNANPSKGREAAKRYKLANPQVARESNNRRRALKTAQLCRCCTREEFQELFRIATLVSGDVDHRVALSLGGHHCTRNLQVLLPADHAIKTAFDRRKLADSDRFNKVLKAWGYASDRYISTEPATETGTA